MKEKELRKRFKNEISKNKPIIITDEIINESKRYAKKTLNNRLYFILAIILFSLFILKDIAGLTIILITGAIAILTMVITIMLVKNYTLHIHQNNYLMTIHKYNKQFGNEYEDIYNKSLSVKTKADFINFISLILNR